MIINLSAFSISLVLQSAFFLRFRFNCDRAALLILLLYLSVTGFRTLISKLLYKTLDLIITPATTTIIYSLLYFFVFEMSYMRALIESESREEYGRRKAQIGRQRGICVLSMVGVFWPVSQFVIMFWIRPNVMEYSMVVMRGLAIVGSATYCSVVFIKNLKFFIE